MNAVLKLSSGRVVKCRVIGNGVIEAELSDGGVMTDEEWAEYCSLARDDSLREIEAALAARHARSKAAFANRQK